MEAWNLEASSKMRYHAKRSIFGEIPPNIGMVGFDQLAGLFSRGIRKRQRQERVIARHLNQYGGFQFRGHIVDVPNDLCLSIQSLIADGTYEAAECALIERYLPADLPVIELGGCLGLVSGLVARTLSTHTQQIVVEANASILDTCWRNATLAGTRTKTEVVAKALGYGSVQVPFDIHANVHVSKLSVERQVGSTLVDATTLRELVEMLEEPTRYALICDIEGAEVDLLENDADALGNCMLLIMELHPEINKTSGHTVGRVIELVCEAGLIPIAQEGNVYAFQRLDAQLS